LVTDEALYNNVRDASTNVAKATAKLSENTTTAGKLFSDPQLYDNLAGLTGDLRLLIGDFRQNPKKFLHFKVTVF
jgi:phospholipid/cholesterol/gamma-HCH transport system substrate-binding protein